MKVQIKKNRNYKKKTQKQTQQISKVKNKKLLAQSYKATHIRKENFQKGKVSLGKLLNDFLEKKGKTTNAFL